MKIKSLFMSIMILAIILSPLKATAEDNTYNSNSSQGTMLLECQLQETYQIVMPATVNLIYDDNTGNYVGSYTIQCKACLVDDEAIVIKPTTYAPILVNGSGGSNPMAKITTIVEQPIDTWTRNPVSSNEIQCSSSEFIQTTGTITIPRENYSGRKAGRWYYNLNFTFTKTSTTP